MIEHSTCLIDVVEASGPEEAPSKTTSRPPDRGPGRSEIAAYGLLVNPTIANAVWLSAGVLLVMLIVGVMAWLRRPDARMSASP